MTKASIPSNSHFQPCQIVCLEHENALLYAEVIQVVETRQMCWVRPLMLTILPQEVANSGMGNLPLAKGGQQGRMPTLQEPVLYDLRQGADLVWPMTLFRPALDTNVIPLLVRLDDPDFPPLKGQLAKQQLSCFVRQVWQAHKSEF